MPAFGVLLLTAEGCSGRPNPVGVSGTVTLDGKPLPQGNLLLNPVSEIEGQRRDVAVTEGKFNLPKTEGVLPGLEFKVSIKAFKKTGKKYPNADMSLSYDEEVQYLPEKYNSASTLRVKISPDERENQLKFELTSR